VDALVELVHVLGAAGKLGDLEQGRLCLGGAGLALELPLERGNAPFEGGGARGPGVVRGDSGASISTGPVLAVGIEDSERRGSACRVSRYDPTMQDRRWVKPVTLEGRIVRLEPLSLDHLDDLAHVAFEGNLWRWTAVQPTDVAGLRAWIESAVAAAGAGAEMPFATIDQTSGRAVGSTRFMSIVPEHKRLEIGWTWVALAHQRTGANREAKLLQMTHAFETLGANRVEFKTDSLNEKANPGLLGIGATYEGTFRNHMVMPGGRLRHSTYYSVIADEWPDVKARLQAKLARP